MELCKNCNKGEGLYLSKTLCKICYDKYRYKQVAEKRRTPFTKEWHSKRLGALKRSAKRRGHYFSLTKEDAFKIYESKSCFFCGEKDIIRTIDRLDNEIGYIKENCVLSCKTCNFLKGSIKKSQVQRLMIILKKMV
jgi:hypothetical protein